MSYSFVVEALQTAAFLLQLLFHHRLDHEFLLVFLTFCHVIVVDVVYLLDDLVDT